MSSDLHDLLVPYALDALDPHERSRFENHLDQCDVCRSELTGFHATSVRLAEASAELPPASLRTDVLARARSTAQERPIVTSLVQRSRARRTLPRLAVAASVLVAAVGVGGYVAERDRAEDLRAESERMTAIMTAEDATMVAAPVETGGDLRIMRSDAHDAAVVIGSSLRALDDDHTYQLWVMNNGKPRSAGFLSAGSGMVYAQGVGKADGYAVTIEPVGGSDLPTTPPIASMSA